MPYQQGQKAHVDKTVQELHYVKFKGSLGNDCCCVGMSALIAFQQTTAYLADLVFPDDIPLGTSIEVVDEHHVRSFHLVGFDHAVATVKGGERFAFVFK